MKTNSDIYKFDDGRAGSTSIQTSGDRFAIERDIKS